MHQFIDNKKRAWEITIDVATVKRIRSLTGADVMALVAFKTGESSLIERLQSDPVLLCDMIFAACKPFADSKSISDSDFGEAMAGDAIEHATAAFLAECVDFFPNTTDRENLRAVMEKSERAASLIRKVQKDRVESLDPEKIVKSVLENAGKASTDAPAS